MSENIISVIVWPGVSKPVLVQAGAGNKGEGAPLLLDPSDSQCYRCNYSRAACAGSGPSGLRGGSASVPCSLPHSSGANKRAPRTLGHRALSLAVRSGSIRIGPPTVIQANNEWGWRARKSRDSSVKNRRLQFFFSQIKINSRCYATKSLRSIANLINDKFKSSSFRNWTNR